MDKPTVQDIFLRFYPRYLEQYRPSPQQAKTANNIINCKTGAYGANVSVCEDCGSIQIYYNSCRNRCCPILTGRMEKKLSMTNEEKQFVANMKKAVLDGGKDG